MNLRLNWFAILEGIGILAGFFYGTMLLLYVWDSSRRIPPVFVLTVDPPNWTVANSNTKAVPFNEGVRIESLTREGEYMLLTGNIVGRPRGSYYVTYELKQLDGATIIGVFDNENNKWINSRLVGQAKDELFFSAPKNSFQIVLQNGLSSPNTSVLAELRVVERH